MKHNLILTLAAAALLAVGCHCDRDARPASGSDAALQAIMNRKSVRAYTGDTIPAATLDRLLRAACAAPSGMDVRPWHLVVLTDKSQYDSIFGDNHNMRMFKQSAAVVVFCADTLTLMRDRNNPDADPVERPNPMWRDDMGAATENFLLAAEACGLGACWTACYPFTDRMEPVRRALRLPASVVPYSIVPVGVLDGEQRVKDKWNPDRIHYGRW